MFKKIIFLVKGYKLAKIGDNYASPASFRLELREACKRSAGGAFYFQKDRNKVAKNFGCFVFGQPDTWKGVLGIEYEEPKNGEADITIYVDKFRISNPEDIHKVKVMVKEALEYLKKEKLIESYISYKEKK